MNNTRFRVVGLVAILVAVGFSFFADMPSVSALSCVPPNPDDARTPAEHLRLSDYVLVGTVGAPKRENSSEQADYFQDVQVADWVKGSTGEKVVSFRSDGTWSAPLTDGQTIMIIDSHVAYAADEYNVSGKTEFSNPLCPGDGPAVVYAESVEYAEYSQLLDSVRDDTVSPPPTPTLDPTALPSAPLGAVSYIIGFVFGILLALLGI